MRPSEEQRENSPPPSARGIKNGRDRGDRAVRWAKGSRSPGECMTSNGAPPAPCWLPQAFRKVLAALH